MTCFITGGNGFVGRAFIEWLSLHQPDLTLRCLVRDWDASAWMAAYPKISRVQGDLLRPETYADALQGVSQTFHIAALVGLRDGDAFYTQNTVATRCLVETLQRVARNARITFISSIAAVDRPKELPAVGPLTNDSTPCPGSDYGKSKLEAENVIRDSGLAYTVLRPAYIYGERTRIGSSTDRFLKDVASEKRYTTLPFPGRVSGIDVQDLAQAIWRSANSVKTLGKTYFVSNPEPIGVSDAIRQIADVLGLEHRFRTVGLGTGERLAAFCRYRAMNPLIARILFEDAFYCDSRPLWDDLAWQPQLTYAEGIRNAAKACVTEKPTKAH